MKDGSLVSVIIPVYNNERTLKKCITSIVDQTYQNVEIMQVGMNDFELGVVFVFCNFLIE